VCIRESIGRVHEFVGIVLRILKSLGRAGYAVSHVHTSRFPYPFPDSLLGTLYLLLWLLLSGFPTFSKLLWLTDIYFSNTCSGPSSLDDAFVATPIFA
jgi:hypothetical protein